MFINPFVCSSINPSIHLCYLYIYLYIYFFIVHFSSKYISAYPSVHLFIYPSLNIYIYYISIFIVQLISQHFYLSPSTYISSYLSHPFLTVYTVASPILAAFFSLALLPIYLTASAPFQWQLFRS